MTTLQPVGEYLVYLNITFVRIGFQICIFFLFKKKKLHLKLHLKLLHMKPQIPPVQWVFALCCSIKL